MGIGRMMGWLREGFFGWMSRSVSVRPEEQGERAGSQMDDKKPAMHTKFWQGRPVCRGAGNRHQRDRVGTGLWEHGLWVEPATFFSFSSIHWAFLTPCYDTR